MSSHLSRTSFEVLLQHAQLDDITGVPDDCHYGNRVTAPDVAVETLGTVKAEGTGHPEPRLQIHTEIHKWHRNCICYGTETFYSIMWTVNHTKRSRRHFKRLVWSRVSCPVVDVQRARQLLWWVLGLSLFIWNSNVRSNVGEKVHIGTLKTCSSSKFTVYKRNRPFEVVHHVTLSLTYCPIDL